MELRHLRYFLAVARTENFTQAAQDVAISQPALSQQIMQLESELGTQLFNRIGRRVRLTSAGTLFRDYAAKMLRDLTEVQTVINELEGLKRGSVSIGTVQTVNSYLMPEVVADFVAAYPGISVSVREMTADDLEKGVAQGELHCGISFVPPGRRGLTVERLFEEDLVLVTTHDHPLAEHESLALSELKDEPLVLLSNAFCTRRLINQNFTLVGITPRVTVEMNSIEGILATISRTGSATILPALAVDCAGGRFRATRLHKPTPRRCVGILWPTGSYHCAAARAFADRVVEAIPPPLRLEPREQD